MPPSANRGVNSLVQDIQVRWNTLVKTDKTGLIHGYALSEKQKNDIKYYHNADREYSNKIFSAIEWIGYNQWDKGPSGKNGKPFCPSLAFTIRPDNVSKYADLMKGVLSTPKSVKLSDQHVDPLETKNLVRNQALPEPSVESINTFSDLTTASSERKTLLTETEDVLNPNVPNQSNWTDFCSYQKKHWNSLLEIDESGLMKEYNLSENSLEEIKKAFENDVSYQKDAWYAMEWVGYYRWDNDKPSQKTGKPFCPNVEWTISPSKKLGDYASLMKRQLYREREAAEKRKGAAVEKHVQVRTSTPMHETQGVTVVPLDPSLFLRKSIPTHGEALYDDLAPLNQ